MKNETRYPYHLRGVANTPNSLVYAPGAWEFTATRDGAVETRGFTTTEPLIDAEAVRVAWTLEWAIPGGPACVAIVSRPGTEEVKPWKS